MADDHPFPRAFYDALLSVDRIQATKIAERSVVEGIDFVESTIVPALLQVGADWEQGRAALSQVYMSGRIAEEIVETILPSAAAWKRRQPAMAIAVLEDYHLLGKRIVHSVLRASGYEVTDFGHGLKAETLARKTIEARIRILLISTLMLPSALRVRDVRRALEQAGAPVKIVVGGAPFRFDHRLWRDVGADVMGATAAEAIGIVGRLAEEAA